MSDSNIPFNHRPLLLGAHVFIFSMFSDLFTPWQKPERSMPAPSTRVVHGGPDTPWNHYLGSALESPVKSVSADLHFLLLMASSACEDWREDGQGRFHPHLSPPFMKPSKGNTWHDPQLITKTFFFLFYTFCPSPWPLLNNYTGFHQPMLKLRNSNESKTAINQMSYV